VSARSVTVTNKYDFVDLSHVRFEWTVSDETGAALASGELSVPSVPAGSSVDVPMPDLPSSGEGSVWLTVRAVLATACSWAPAGHELGSGQRQLSDGTSVPEPASLPAWFTSRGSLSSIGSLPVSGPTLDLWRATTDNDRGEHGVPVAPRWHALGLDRPTHSVRSVSSSDASLSVAVRSAPAATDLGMLSTYSWTGAGDGVRLQWSVTPSGPWDVPLPRLGLLFELPASISSVEWFGLGPGESYVDSTQAVRMGRYTSSVDELQTPYVFPQENGNRRSVRWLTLRTSSGTGVRIAAASESFDFSVRRWTSADLEAARHTTDLVPRSSVYLNLDVGQNGLGTASCGPGVLPQYELHAGPASLDLVFTPLS
jgi:beta-galactosidase